MKKIIKTFAFAIVAMLFINSGNLKANTVNNFAPKTENTTKCWGYYSVVSYETKTDCKGCVVTYKVTKWYYYGCLIKCCKQEISKNCNLPTEQ